MGRYQETFSMEEELKGVDPNSAKYAQIVQKHMKKELDEIKRQEEAAKKHKLVLLIIDLLTPIKGVSVSKFSYMSYDEIVAIGKAARALNEAYKKGRREGGGGYTRDRWSDDY
jgi:hypothetical protein